ncbi:thermonuclease family protein [Brevibacillus sp. SYSU BS000544]|uniref:thermonuclease family protein n=1 Tax=Brevibacillus sp. SYSU BS000544 TaxID=3416443 RepID=UPI003CE52C28
MRKLLLLLFLITSLFLSGCTNQTAQTNPNRIPAQVIKVIDGDTIKARFDNQTATIRFLLVDTPETHHPTLRKQPFGEEAYQFTKKLLDGQQIELEQDVSPGPDKYGRYLYYIYINGNSVQEMLLENGLARVAYVYVPNVKYVDRYREIQDEARKAKKGIWSIEDYAGPKGFDSNADTEQEDPPAPCDAPKIKGNITKKGEKIYHLPESRSYQQTKPEKWFCTEQEAVEAGFRKAGN